MGMHVTGGLSAIYILSQLGFILALFGLVLGIGGFSLLRTALVPILFLLFAIPMPYFINSLVSFKLQLISSELGTYFIRMFQIPVYRDGNIIDLGNYKLQVVEACSGLRYIYPLLSLGFLAAYFCNAPFWQRCLLFLSTVPLTILMNGVRIGLVGITVNYWGTQAANDVLHFFEGWIIFVLCAGVLMLEIYCFARASDKTFFEMFCLPGGTPESSGMMRVKAGSQLPLVCSLLLLCITGIAIINVSGRPEIIPDRFRFVAFPERIGTWQGRAIYWSRKSNVASLVSTTTCYQITKDAEAKALISMWRTILLNEKGNHLILRLFASLVTAGRSLKLNGRVTQKAASSFPSDEWLLRGIRLNRLFTIGLKSVAGKSLMNSWRNGTYLRTPLL